MLLKKRLPQIDFVGVGAARSGSTWAARVLNEHPEVFVPSRKELHLFNNGRLFRKDDRLGYRGQSRLRRYFSGLEDGQTAGEFTPRYMISKDALRRIRKNLGDVKIICILRDPVERAYSQYRYFIHNKRKEHEPDFERALTGKFREDYITKSQYAPLMRLIYDLFDDNHVLWILYDDLSLNPGKVARILYEFLGVDSAYRPAAVEDYVNFAGGSVGDTASDKTGRDRLLHTAQSGSERQPHALPEEVRRRVFERYFAEDVRTLEDILKVNLGSWRPEA